MQSLRRWLRDVTFWVDESLSNLEETLEQLNAVLHHENPSADHADAASNPPDAPVRSASTSRPPTPSHILRLNDKARGRGETSYSRANYYASTHYSDSRNGTGRPQPGNRNIDREGRTSLTAISAYGTIFASLSAISFFGASTAWTSVFSAAQGDIVLLVWSASLFAVSVVAAGSAGAIASSDQIDFERDTVPRRTFGAFATASAMLILGGLFLLSAAAFELDPVPSVFDMSQKRLFRAAGATTIGTSCVCVSVAVGVRIAYSHNRSVFGRRF